MLAIVIPFFKIDFFDATLKSLADQNNKQFKVYIGDDNSPENAIVLIKKFESQFEFVYQRFDYNLGGTSLVSQWERCIELVQDESWIMILGDDDVLEDNVVEEFYKHCDLFENEINVVRFATVKIDAQNHATSLKYEHPTEERSTDFIFRTSRSSLSEYVFRKECLLEVGFVDLPLAWFSDILAILEVSEFNTIYTINEAVVRIRVSEYSISGSQKNKQLKTKANFDFYAYLLKKHSECFTEIQLVHLENSWQKIFFNNKNDIGFFLEISSYYLKKMRFKNYILFLFNSLRSKVNFSFLISR